MNQPLSVSQAVALVKDSLEQIAVTIVGEVSELSDKPGYRAVYFTIGDATATLSCLIWRNIYEYAGVKLRQGMLVEVSGFFSIYPAKGRMNFEVRALKPAGEGELRIRVAQLAKKLESEGLMDPQKKRPLPNLPCALAVVTSLHGKAVHDVLRTLKRRYPLVEVLLVGVQVEGNGAVQSMLEGLEVAQNSEAELILLVRGGGSYEDLMPFNDEKLARAIASSPLPVVTGIGHEPDTSIADMVSDYRASTPTAAAEHVVPDINELKSDLDRMGATLRRMIRTKIENMDNRYNSYINRPVFTDPQRMYASHALLVDGAALRLQQLFPNKLAFETRQMATIFSRLNILAANHLRPFEAQIQLYAASLHALSPVSVLTRGYSISFDQNGHVIDSTNKVEIGQFLRIQLLDGFLGCQVHEIKHSGFIGNLEEHDD